MRDDSKSKKELINELGKLRNQNAEYKKTIEEITKHTDELEVTFNSIGDGAVITDIKSNISFFNTKAEEITGWESKHAVGKPVDNVLWLVNEQSNERRVTPVKSSIDTGRSAGLKKDTALITRDGTKLFVSASCAPVRDKKGKITGAVFIFRDITRIKQIEKALQQSEKKYRTIVENTFDLIYEVDSKGKILYVNPACKELAGYEQFDLLGKNVFDFIHPDDVPKAASVFQKAVSNLSTEKITFRARDKSGRYHWLECIGKPFITPTRETRGVIIARDVTERKKSENELLILNTVMKVVHQFYDLKEVYKVALDMIIHMENVDMAAIYIVDKENNEAVLQAHRNFPESFTSKAGRISYPKGITWKVINSGELINIEDAQKDPDIGPAGREMGQHGILGIPIFSQKDVIGVIWFLSYKERIFDESEVGLLSAVGGQIAIAIAKAKLIEELKFAQEQLIQSEKLASLGQLLSSIAHEINNPLTPVIGYSQTLLMQQGLDEKNKRALELIHTSAQRVVKIVEKLLSFSRKDKPIRTYEDLNNLVMQSMEFREYQLKLGNIDIVYDLDPGLPKTMVDPNQIQQVFTNIILNAEQAISECQDFGRLEVRTRLKNGKRIEISFSDTGPGITKDAIGKVFDPFYTTKDPGKGTGLGLSVAYGIIKEHDGEIRALSEEGKGTTFIIELPLEQADTFTVRSSGQEENISEDSEKIKDKKILVVEDEDLVIELMKSMFEEECNEIHIARNGSEALGMLSSNQYDLIICDIKMPEMNGIDLYNEIRKENPDIVQRIIFITGDPSNETIDFLDALENEVITKPFDIEQFKTRINNLFSRN